MDPNQISARPYDRIQSELLQRLRQNQSQLGLSRKLGYKTNQYHKWESGRSHLSWQDFVAVCGVLEINLAFQVQEALFFHSPNNLQPAALVNHLTRGRSPSEVASLLGISKSMISRWTTGAMVPSLIQVLQLIDIGIYSLSAFIDRLLPDPDQPLESLSLEDAAREMNFKYPWAGALLRIFETEAYAQSDRHESRDIAEKLGITPETVEIALTQLLQVGMIEKHGEKYRTREKLRITMDGKGRTAPIVRYWLKRTSAFVEKMERSDEKNVAGYLVFSSTPEATAELHAAYLEFYQKALNIIHAKRPGTPDSVMLLNVQIVDALKLPALKPDAGKDS